jgi:hypothetical protein
MRKIIVGAQVSIDGVTQAPGGPTTTQSTQHCNKRDPPDGN